MLLRWDQNLFPIQNLYTLLSTIIFTFNLFYSWKRNQIFSRIFKTLYSSGIPYKLWNSFPILKNYFPFCIKNAKQESHWWQIFLTFPSTVPQNTHGSKRTHMLWNSLPVVNFLMARGLYTSITTRDSTLFSSTSTRLLDFPPRFVERNLNYAKTQLSCRALGG